MIEDGSAQAQVSESRERGGCLSVFLIAGMIFFALGAVYLFLTSLLGIEALQDLAPSISREYWIWGAFLGLANFIAFLGIWWWRRWGVYAFVAISFIGFLVDISRTVGGGMFNLLRGVVLVGLLLILIRNKWSMMD